MANKMDKYMKLEDKISEINLLVEEDDNLLVIDVANKMARANRRRATKLAKKRMADLARYSDDEIIAKTGKVKSTGYRSYEKGSKAWSRKIRHEKFVQKYEVPESTYELILEANKVMENFFSYDIWDTEGDSRAEIEKFAEEHNAPEAETVITAVINCGYFKRYNNNHNFMVDFAVPEVKTVIDYLKNKEFDGLNPWTINDEGEQWYLRKSMEMTSPDLTAPIKAKVYNAWEEYKYALTMEAWEELIKIKKSIIKVLELNKILHSDKLADIIENLADNWSGKF